jgi:hypothetical protein
MKNPSLLLPALLAIALPARAVEPPAVRLNVIHIVADDLNGDLGIPEFFEREMGFR